LNLFSIHLDARRLLVALLSAATLPALAADAASARTNEVAARLVAATASAQPGQTLLLGVQQRIVEHWHTYWVNPGDSGLATTIAWTLPAGATAGPIQWPVPARYQVGPITNYGYANEVTLLSAVQVPATLKDGDDFTVQAKVDWLVCYDICIPQQVNLALTLPVRATAPQVGPDEALVRAAQARLPTASPGALRWQRDGEALKLQFADTPALPAHDAAYFYAATWGQVAHPQPQALQREPWQLSLPVGEAPPKAGDPPIGVLVLSQAGQPVASYAIGHDPAPTGPAVKSAQPGPTALPASAQAEAPGLLLALGLALLGGLVLNLMPCVFPVLTIKALSLFQSAGQSRRTVRLHGAAYAAGVLASFAALAALLIALKAGGDSAGWGFQFQSPVFVLLLALLMFAVGLSLSGVFALGGSVTGVGSNLATRAGYSGSFFTGVLATVVATPCTAPFMGAAVGYALTQPATVTMAVFLALGTGLALPYLLLCEWPALQRLLPRPGAWMERLKQALAFPMYASAAWLAWVLTQQAGAQALAVALGCAVVLAFAAWLYDSTRPLGARGHLAGSVAASLLAIAAVAAGPASLRDVDTAVTAQASSDGWEPYSPERLQALRDQGKPVFVNLTAAWCITCLVNERVALGTERVESAFALAKVTRLKGDWTRRDERITRLLAEHGRSGVPLYLYYPAGAGSAPTLLPQLLTPDLVVAVLDLPPSP
jgi:thiol:disulfide interchange protein DsbD